MASPLHTVVETPRFLHDAEVERITGDERVAIVDAIAANPAQGDEVRGSGGVRKVRVAGRGKGKSGGYRIMVAYLGHEVPAYLLAVLSKGTRANFTAAEIERMRRATTEIERYWRERRRR